MNRRNFVRILAGAIATIPVIKWFKQKPKYDGVLVQTSPLTLETKKMSVEYLIELEKYARENLRLQTIKFEDGKEYILWPPNQNVLL